MSKRTLALVTILLFVAVGLVAIAVSLQKPSRPAPTPTQSVPTPTPLVQTVLSMSPNPFSVAPNASTSASVLIETGRNSVTAVQLELSFDPKVLENVTVAPPATAGFFANPIVLLNNIDSKNGKATFAIAIPPAGTPASGQGTVAVVSFTVRGALGQRTTISILPTSLVTATGAASSVLKSTSGTTVVIR